MSDLPSGEDVNAGDHSLLRTTTFISKDASSTTWPLALGPPVSSHASEVREQTNSFTFSVMEEVFELVPKNIFHNHDLDRDLIAHPLACRLSESQQGIVATMTKLKPNFIHFWYSPFQCSSMFRSFPESRTWVQHYFSRLCTVGRALFHDRCRIFFSSLRPFQMRTDSALLKLCFSSVALLSCGQVDFVG